MTLRAGQDVRITKPSNTYYGARGTISSVTVMVLLEGETKSMCFEQGAFEVLVGVRECPAGTGAE